MVTLSYEIPITVYLLGFLFEVSYTRASVLGNDIREKFRKRMNICLGVIIFMVAALRAPNTGMDTGGYYAMFNDILAENQPVSYYWDQVITALKTGTFSDNMFWSFFMKLGTYVIHDPQVWLAFVASLYLFSVYVIIDKYSDDPVISWLYIYFIFIFGFVLQGLRQSVAMACVMLSFYYIRERKLKNFLVLIGIAFLFHQSAIVFLAAYPISKLKITRGCLATVVVATLCQFAPSLLLGWLRNFLENTRFEYYTDNLSGLSWTSFAIQLAIFSFCFYYREKNDEQSELMTILLNFSVVGIFLQSMTVIVAEMFRVSYYFNMFNMLMLANACKGLGNSRTNQYYRLGVITLLIAYNLISGVYKYWFFWQV